MVPPTNSDASLSGSSWTNTPRAEWTDFAGATGKALSLNNSSGTPVVTLTFNIAPQKQLDITGFSFWTQRSGTGAQAWTMRINNNVVGNGTMPTGGTVAANPALTTPVTSLTGTVTVTLSLSGATGNGTWRLDDFTLFGTVTNTCTPPVVSSLSPATAPVGTVVTLNGSGFATGTTAVLFNGTPATSYQVVSDTQIKAIVPAGTSGIVKVTTNNCTGESTGAFTYLTANCPGISNGNDLFISEVYDADRGEGGAIELYNPTALPINLAQYTLRKFRDANPNQGTAPLQLVGTVPPGEVYLVGKKNNNIAVCDINSSVELVDGFNDLDEFVLLKNGVVIDDVICPNQTGFSMYRNFDAVKPKVTYSGADWNTLLIEDCADLGRYNIPTTPQASFTAQPQNTAICHDATATFTATAQNATTGYTYQWKTLDNGIWVNVVNNATYSGAQTATLNVVGSAALDGNQYYLEVTSASCTIVSNAALLTVNAAPETPIANVVQPTCTNPVATITITPVAGVTYSFDNLAFNVNNEFTMATPGTYAISVKNAAGCITSSTVTVDAVPNAPATPTAVVTQPDCTNTTATITIDNTITGLTYSFDGSAFGTNNVFTTTVAGTYTISVKNASGCTTSSTVTVDAAPNAPATPIAAVIQPTCTNPVATITIDNTVTGLTYSFDGSTFGTSNVFTTTVAGTYTISVQNAAGCITSSTITVDAAPNAPATPSAIVTQPTCTNTTATITIDNTVTGLTYSFDGSVYGSNNVFTTTTPGTYTISVQNTTGCIASATITVNAAPNAPATPSAIVAQPTCTNPTATITIDNTVTGLTYSFNGSAYGTNNVFTTTVAGTYAISVQNAAGCIASATVTVDVLPNAPATPVAVVAQPSCTNATATITIDNTITGLTYSFDGSAYGTNNVFTTTVAGTYTISVQNATGCITSSTITVNTVPNAPATPTAVVTQPTCTNPTATITIDNTVTGLTYSFDGSAYGANNVFTTITAGTYTIGVQNAAGCTTSSTVTVNAVPNAPVTPTATVTQPTCAIDTATITIDTATGLTYSFNGSAYGANNVFTIAAAGTYTISVQNAAGCTSSSTVTVNVAPQLPVISLAEGCMPTTNGREFLLELITTDTNLDLNTLTYEWKRETTGSSTIVSTDGPVFNVSEYVADNNITTFPLYFTLKVTTPQGCTATFSGEAAGVLCDIPRGISPNGDGKNDAFDLSGMNVSSISIFNRYGLEVYKKGAYTNEWHGQTDGGHDLPTGTYFYVVKTGEGSKTGWVYINREIR